MDRTSCSEEGELSINTDIVNQTGILVNTKILPQVRAKHQGLFKFGVQALSFSPFNSLNSNARQIIENTNTACSKVYRLVSKESILNYFPKLLTKLDLVNRKSLVNVDFSTFCGFETLAFGVQTKEGRAIPVWANCITYPIKEVGSQNKFVIEELKKFGSTLGFYPGFIFDRGFWIPDMLTFFLEDNIPFYLRIKAGKQLEWSDDQGKNRKISALRIGKCTKDTSVTLNLKSHEYKNHQYKLRLVISPPPPKKKGKLLKERWYILTNDLSSSREKVLDIYKHRFEIEETFKDLKHVSKLKKFLIRKKLTFKILLSFTCLAFWIAYLCRKFTKLRPATSHPKKKRSYFKTWWEEIQRQMRIPLLNLFIPDG